MWKVVAALALLVSSNAYAQHQTYQGTGVVCDEPEQVARYVRSAEGEGTLAAINAEKPHSCAIMKIAFFMGETRERIATSATSSGTWQITKILIVGVDVGQGIQPVDPVVQWSAFHVEGELGA
jgi:hypothetical protein